MFIWLGCYSSFSLLMHLCATLLLICTYGIVNVLLQNINTPLKMYVEISEFIA